MVRGESGCPSYCYNCANDCRCNSCGHCHTCRDINHFTGQYYHGNYVDGCRYYSHACVIPPVEPPPRAWPEAFISRLKDLPTLFNSEIIQITIGKGDNKQVRHVPKDALTEQSEYFKRSFAFHDKAGTKGDTVVLDTDADKPDAFDRFLQFVYGKDYFVSSPTEETDLDLRLHADVYVLAERLQAPALKEAAMKKATALAVKFSKRLKDTTTMEEAKVNLSCVTGTVEVVYLNTPSPPEDDETKKDKFRSLVAIFSAYALADLKKTVGFLECIRGFPDFAADLITHVRDGNALQVDGDGNLKI